MDTFELKPIADNHIEQIVDIVENVKREAEHQEEAELQYKLGATLALQGAILELVNESQQLLNMCGYELSRVIVRAEEKQDEIRGLLRKRDVELRERHCMNKNKEGGRRD